MNQLVMVRSIPIAADGNKGVGINTCHVYWSQLLSHAHTMEAKGGKYSLPFASLN
jgi:hypothetical protein